MGQLSAALRDRGYRLTLQREIILDTLEAISGHIVVEDIYRSVHSRFPQVNMSTIYRTMELLEQEGLIAHIHFHAGVAKWHRSEEARHQHLVCERCGTEAELDLTLIAPLAQEILDRYGFEANLTHFAIVGVCGSCKVGEPRLG